MPRPTSFTMSDGHAEFTTLLCVCSEKALSHLKKLSSKRPLSRSPPCVDAVQHGEHLVVARLAERLYSPPALHRFNEGSKHEASALVRADP